MKRNVGFTAFGTLSIQQNKSQHIIYIYIFFYLFLISSYYYYSPFLKKTYGTYG